MSNSRTLAEHLRHQLKIYQEICRTEEAKNAALRRRDVAVLEQITRVERELVKAAAEMEEKRREISVAGRERLTAESAELREKLTAAAATLKALNESNERLIRQELRYIDYSLRTIAAGGEKSRLYSAVGTGVAGTAAGVKLYDQHT